MLGVAFDLYIMGGFLDRSWIVSEEIYMYVVTLISIKT